MSGLIHFSSGKTLKITDVEFRNMPIKLNGKGIKTQKTQEGHLIPLNSMTMEYIEHIPEQPVAEPETTKEVLRSDEHISIEPEPEKKTEEQVMAEITDKSNCLHEPEKQELYIQHTAKGLRYFPVCSFCGKRERYVSESKIVEGQYKGTPNEKWTEADIANAKPWIED